MFEKVVYCLIVYRKTHSHQCCSSVGSSVAHQDSMGQLPQQHQPGEREAIQRNEPAAAVQKRTQSRDLTSEFEQTLLTYSTHTLLCHLFKFCITSCSSSSLVLKV